MDSSGFNISDWASKPAEGLHLTVTKDDEIIQKLFIDKKSCYFFGRDCNQSDFVINHESCSRLHASLTYHKHLNLFYLMDFGSTHGTWIGNRLIEPHTPTPIRIGSFFHFGFSTRKYTLCENTEEKEIESEPIIEIDIDALTDFNTQFNKNISANSNTNSNITKTVKRKCVQFIELEDFINDDNDPSIGRFQNLVQSTLIPTKKICLESSTSTSIDCNKNENDFSVSSTIATIRINPAPEVEIEQKKI